MTRTEQPSLDRTRYKTLSFDCYGTLIDWETGITDFLQPLLAGYDVHVIDEWVLETFAVIEPEVQSRGGTYHSVLAEVLREFGARLAFSPNDQVSIQLPGLRYLPAFVVWTNENVAGLQFEEPLYEHEYQFHRPGH